jgi:uncharacterized RDD family membrane protein YckC
MNEQPASVPSTPLEDVTGVRILAALIDLVLLAILFVVVAILIGDSSSGGEDEKGFSVRLNNGPLLLYVLLCMAYYFLMEAFSGGQTIGKRLMKLRVVALEGALTPSKVLLRTLCRIVDGLPFLYLLGLIMVATSQRKQRIGDMAAGTIVVRA